MPDQDQPLKVTIYTPDSALRDPRKLLREMLNDLRASRELAWRLAVRDISAQYRQTALGVLWAFILPLAHTLVWVFLNSTGVVTLHDTALPYPVYVFTGTMLWAIFMDAANAPLRLTVAAKPMLAKINFPREALIVSGVYQTLFNAAIKLVILLPAIILLGVVPDAGLLLFPLALAALILIGTTLGLLLTPVGVLYGDIGKSFPLLMQFLMFLSPVVYAIPTNGWASQLLLANPLTPIILNARNWLTGQGTEMLAYFVTANLVAVCLLGILWVAYRAAMPILIERMSA